VLRLLRLVLVLVALALAAKALGGQWGKVRGHLGDLSVGWTAVAVLTAFAGQAAIAVIWREVLSDLGSRLPLLIGCRIFLLAQLGKYIPGSVFAVAGQVELATRYDVPRQRSATASVVTIVLNIGVGGVVALCALPLLPDRLASPFRPALLLLPLVGLLHPKLFTAVLNRALRLIRRPALDQALSASGLARASAWCIVSWLLLGLHIYALCRDVGADAPVLGLSVAGFAAAWLVGFVVVIAPAGFGPREAVLVAVLSSSLVGGTSAALLVAGVSRLVLVLIDVLLAGLALWVGSSPARYRARPERPALVGTSPAPPGNPRGGP